MCFHSKQEQDAKTLENRFKEKILKDETITSGIFNGFEHPKTPVILNTEPKLIQLLSGDYFHHGQKKLKYKKIL